MERIDCEVFRDKAMFDKLIYISNNSANELDNVVIKTHDIQFNVYLLPVCQEKVLGYFGGGRYGHREYPPPPLK